MAADTPSAVHSFDLKSAELPVLAVTLRSTEVEQVIADLARRLADDPDFFDNDPVLIDLQHVQHHPEPIDFARLIAALRHHRTRPVAVRSGSAAQMQAAHEAGLVPAPDATIARPKERIREVEVEVIREVPIPVEVVREVPLEVIRPTMVIDKPLRSGQQVYARGRDLVLRAMVNPGAEVIADGHIHIYAPLRGRAIAGARGWPEARIFALEMKPELVSISGVYRTSEEALPEAVWGHAATVRLQSTDAGDKLIFEPVKP